MDGGCIKAQDCGQEKPYVCITAPLYRRPDNRCPRDHHSYKGECYREMFNSPVSHLNLNFNVAICCKRRTLRKRCNFI